MNSSKKFFYFFYVVIYAQSCDIEKKEWKCLGGTQLHCGNGCVISHCRVGDDGRYLSSEGCIVAGKDVGWHRYRGCGGSRPGSNRSGTSGRGLYGGGHRAYTGKGRETDPAGFCGNGGPSCQMREEEASSLRNVLVLPKKRTGPVTDVGQWVQYFAGFVSVLSTRYPAAVPELMAYIWPPLSSVT